MDTGSYDNILKALNQPQQPAPASPSGGLTFQQQSDNYSAFSDLMKQGVYIPDLLKRIDALEAQVKEQGQRKEIVDADLFSVMEASVKGDEEVKVAKQRLADEKSRVISEICARDEGYRNALDAYRRTVNAAYINRFLTPFKYRSSVRIHICGNFRG